MKKKKYQHKNYIYIKYKKKYCERCGNINGLLVHHRDYDETNNNKSNLETLCYSCQAKEHKFHTHFKEAYKKTKRNKFGRFGKEETPIEIIKCERCKKRTKKQNPKQRFCEKCKIKLNTRHLNKEQLKELMKNENDNKKRRLPIMRKHN